MFKACQVLKAYLLIFLASSSVTFAIPWSLKSQEKEGAAVAPTIEQSSGRDQPQTEDGQSLQPAPPEGGGTGGNGGGDKGGPRVVLFISPPIEGHHKFVVPLKQKGQAFEGGNILNFNETQGYPIEDAVIIEQPDSRSVACLFYLGETLQPTFPTPLFYGEFLKRPVEQMNAILCSTQWYDDYKDHIARYTLLPVSLILKESGDI